MTARARYGPRIGPKTSAGGSSLWVRRIEGVNYLFVSTSTYFAVYDGDHNRLIRYTIKDT